VRPALEAGGQVEWDGASAKESGAVPGKREAAGARGKVGCGSKRKFFLAIAQKMPPHYQVG
jgi:hypothetical protein